MLHCPTWEVFSAAWEVLGATWEVLGSTWEVLGATCFEGIYVKKLRRL